MKIIATKQKMYFKAVSLTLLLFLIVLSCTKDKISGCTDPDSINYNSLAEVEDNSCLYEGSIVFWFGQSISAFLQQDQALSLTYYVNGSIVGSSATNVYWTSAPNCNQAGSVTYKHTLGKNKTATLSFSIKDQTNWEYWSGTVSFEANKCLQYELSDKKSK
jgi:hypothetical protein